MNETMFKNKFTGHKNAGNIITDTDRNTVKRSNITNLISTDKSSSFDLTTRQAAIVVAAIILIGLFIDNL